MDRGVLIERRRASRRCPRHDEPLARVRLRAGRELTVIDVSNAGALVQGAARLLPGTHVDVHVVTPDGRTLVRSRVVRAFVADLQADAVCYRGALMFERLLDTTGRGYQLPHGVRELTADPGIHYPVDTSDSLAGAA